MSQSVSASLDGQIEVAAAPGYPAFFNDLGVKLPDKGGVGINALNNEVPAAGRDREIRSMDIILVQPKTGTRLIVDLNPSGIVTGQSLVSYSLATVNDFLESSEARTVLQTLSEYRPPTLPGDGGDVESIFNLYLDNGDSQFDQLLVARVWMVSRSGAGRDDVPDASWEPYVEHSLFWNLNYAQRLATRKQLGENDVSLVVPLAGGLAQPLVNMFLSAFNTANTDALAFLNQGDSGGFFWST